MLPLKKEKRVIRSSAVLTASYVAATIITIDEHNFFGVNVAYTKGDETSMQMKIEVSTDGGTTWFQQQTESTSGGTITVAAAERSYSATGNYSTIVYPIKVPTSDTADQGQVRVSFKATGGSPTGTVAAESVIGWV